MRTPAAARRAVLAILSQQLRTTADLRYAKLARVGATIGLLGHGHMRHVARAAVSALGRTPRSGAVWRFAWDWWYQRSVDELIACQADRLTPEWAREHVLAPLRPLPRSCILLSMHQYNLAVAAARAVQLVPDLGVVSVIDPLPDDDVEPEDDGFLLPAAERARAAGAFYRRTFEGHIFTPEVAARNALDLLARGGSLIVLPDFYGAVDGRILGRDISVAEGPVWLAERANRPLVPFLLIPPGPREPRWRLWCDEPIEPTQEAVVAMLERSIRRLPTTWAYWRGWLAAPPAGRRPDLITA